MRVSKREEKLEAWGLGGENRELLWHVPCSTSGRPLRKPMKSYERLSLVATVVAIGCSIVPEVFSQSTSFLSALPAGATPSCIRVDATGAIYVLGEPSNRASRKPPRILRTGLSRNIVATVAGDLFGGAVRFECAT